MGSTKIAVTAMKTSLVLAFVAAAFSTAAAQTYKCWGSGCYGCNQEPECDGVCAVRPPGDKARWKEAAENPCIDEGNPGPAGEECKCWEDDWTCPEPHLQCPEGQECHQGYPPQISGFTACEKCSVGGCPECFCWGRTPCTKLTCDNEECAAAWKKCTDVAGDGGLDGECGIEGTDDKPNDSGEYCNEYLGCKCWIA